MAKSIKIHTYRRGFTYQELDDRLIQRIRGKSYRADAAVPLDNLRYLRMLHRDFEGVIREGEMIVNYRIALRTLKVFYHLYKIRYPIEKMRLVDEYEADDEASMADNNTSAFNYREIAHTKQLSNHSRGMAIDINPRMNPYITSYGIAPANSADYEERDAAKCRGSYADCMIHRGDAVYNIFRRYGFSWGGDWEHAKDYQHFEAL